MVVGKQLVILVEAIMTRNYSLPRLIVAWTLLSIGACGIAAAQSPATQAQAQLSLKTRGIELSSPFAILSRLHR
jgi:hypothetical protein